jgi:sulfatase modifying factor 1
MNPPEGNSRAVADVPAAPRRGASPDPAADPAKRRSGVNMAWVPGGTFLMSSDNHYPEEAPAHPVTVSGFGMDRHTVTNRDFARFVAETGHMTVAEQAPDPADYPGARAGAAGAGLHGVRPTGPAGGPG